MQIENEDEFFPPNEPHSFNVYGVDGQLKAIAMTSSAIEIAHREQAAKEYGAAFERMISVLFAGKPNYTVEWWATFVSPLVSHRFVLSGFD